VPEQLNPTDMQSLLTHDWRYQRALAVLKGQWLPIIGEETQPFRRMIQPEDLQFAIALQATGTVTGRFKFDNYAGVQAVQRYFGSQLSTAAQRWLVLPYI